jgi:uncharacterized membrane protein
MFDTADTNVARLEIRPEWSSRTLGPGDSVRHEITLVNQSNLPDTYGLQLDGLPEGWYTLSPSTVYLFPGWSDKVVLEINVPTTANSQNFNISLTMESQSTPELFARTTIELRVNVPGTQTMPVPQPQPSSNSKMFPPNYSPVASGSAPLNPPPVVPPPPSSRLNNQASGYMPMPSMPASRQYNTTPPTNYAQPQSGQFTPQAQPSGQFTAPGQYNQPQTGQVHGYAQPQSGQFTPQSHHGYAQPQSGQFTPQAQPSGQFRQPQTGQIQPNGYTSPSQIPQSGQFASNNLPPQTGFVQPQQPGQFNGYAQPQTPPPTTPQSGQFASPATAPQSGQFAPPAADSNDENTWLTKVFKRKSVRLDDPAQNVPYYAPDRPIAEPPPTTPINYAAAPVNYQAASSAPPVPVIQGPAAGIILKVQHLHIAAGRHFEQTIKLLNLTDQQNTYEVGISGMPAEWFTFSAHEFNLPPNRSEEFLLRTTIPADVTPDEYFGRLYAQLKDSELGRAALNFQVEVTAAPESVAEEPPPVAPAAVPKLELAASKTRFNLVVGTQQEHRFSLTNRLNAADFFDMAIEGVPADWVSLSSSHFYLFPNWNEETDLRLRVPQDATSGIYHARVVVTARNLEDVKQSLDLEITVYPANQTEGAPNVAVLPVIVPPVAPTPQPVNDIPAEIAEFYDIPTTVNAPTIENKVAQPEVTEPSTVKVPLTEAPTTVLPYAVGRAEATETESTAAPEFYDVATTANSPQKLVAENKVAQPETENPPLDFFDSPTTLDASRDDQATVIKPLLHQVSTDKLFERVPPEALKASEEMIIAPATPVVPVLTSVNEDEVAGEPALAIAPKAAPELEAEPEAAALGDDVTVTPVNAPESTGDFEITLKPDRLQLLPGNTLEATVTIINRSGVTGNMEVSLEGLPARLCQLSDDLVYMQPGWSDTLTLKVEVPASRPTASYDGQIIVKCIETPEVGGRKNIHLRIGEPEIENPNALTSGKRATSKVSTAGVALVATDNENALTSGKRPTTKLSNVMGGLRIKPQATSLAAQAAMQQQAALQAHDPNAATSVLQTRRANAAGPIVGGFAPLNNGQPEAQPQQPPPQQFMPPAPAAQPKKGFLGGLFGKKNQEQAPQQVVLFNAPQQAPNQAQPMPPMAPPPGAAPSGPRQYAIPTRSNPGAAAGGVASLFRPVANENSSGNGASARPTSGTIGQPARRPGMTMPHAEVQLELPRLTIVAGNDVEQTISLANYTTLPDDFELSIESLPGNWFAFSDTEINLFPNQGATTKLTTKIPDKVRPNIYVGKVIVYARLQPGIRAEARLEVEVLSPLVVNGRISPKKARGYKANFNLLLRNSSMSDGTFRLSLAPDNRYCQAIFAPDVVRIAGGQNLSVPFKMTIAPKTPGDQKAQEQFFSIVVAPEWDVAGEKINTTEITADAIYKYDSPGGFIRRHPVFFSFLALFIIGFLVWSFLILPGIQATNQLYVNQRSSFQRSGPNNNSLRIEPVLLSQAVQSFNAFSAISKVDIKFTEEEQSNVTSRTVYRGNVLTDTIQSKGKMVVEANLFALKFNISGRMGVNQRTGEVLFIADNQGQLNDFPWILAPPDRLWEEYSKRLRQTLVPKTGSNAFFVNFIEVEGNNLYMRLEPCLSRTFACFNPDEGQIVQPPQPGR